MAAFTVQIHGLACRCAQCAGGWQVTSPDGSLLAAEPSRFLAVARAALAVLALRKP